MNFLIIGGGCYGSFYVRQLLRGADRLGVERIHVVDRDPDCRVLREQGVPGRDSAGRIVFHQRDWKEFLLQYFAETLARDREGKATLDHYVPPCIAPHILLELFFETALSEMPDLVFERKAFEQPLGTPFDTELPAGTRAVSFATWTCPASCIEPPTCPHTRGPKDWDMKDHVIQAVRESALSIDSIHIFQCLHYAMGVGTIPVKAILEEYRRFRNLVKSPGKHLSVMATVSSCHGLVGLVESNHV